MSQTEIPQLDDLLTQATCMIKTDHGRATAWLCSLQGHLLTAGHLFREGDTGNRFNVQFPGAGEEKASLIQFGYDLEKAVDFAILLLEHKPERLPVPIMLPLRFDGFIRARGYGQTLRYQAAAVGRYVGHYDSLDNSDYRLFEINSKYLVDQGFSGAAVFSDNLQAAVAISVERIKPKGDIAGPLHDSILAMPLYRIAELYEPMRSWAQPLPGDRPIRPLSENPFKGLRPYLQDDADDFKKLGRSADIHEIVDLLESEEARVVIVHGEPSIGKTSIIWAGVVPRVKETMDYTQVKSGDDISNPPAYIEKLSFLYENRRNSESLSKKMLVVWDQLENWFERGDDENALAVLKGLDGKPFFKLLIGIRKEYVSKLIGKGLFSDRNLVELHEVDRLTETQAVEMIVYLSQGRFREKAAQKLVQFLCANQERPYTPYIQIVCQQLWKALIINAEKEEINPVDIDDAQIHAILDQYLDIILPKTEPPALASQILSFLVKQSNTGGIVANPVTITHIAAETGADYSVVDSYIQQLRAQGLVFLGSRKDDRIVNITTDYLAKIIFEKYSELIDLLRGAADSLVENLGTVLMNTGLSEQELETVALAFVQDFVTRNNPNFSQIEDLSPVWRRLTLKSDRLKGLMEYLLRPGDLANQKKACQTIDLLVQLLIVVGAYLDADRLIEDFASLALEKLPEAEHKYLLVPYQQKPVERWQSFLKSEKPVLEKDDLAALQKILRLAQEERVHTLSTLILAFTDNQRISPRLLLWRILYKLGCDGQIQEPSISPPLLQVNLFSHKWVLSPVRTYLKDNNALEDRRTYQGVLVHIPAGEHAMRNQRAARKWLIRTVAIEQRWRGTAPGWHEADDRYLIDSYSDDILRQELANIAQDYSTMLNKKQKKMWVVLEAQEYTPEKMVEICHEVEKNCTFAGSILTDVGASIANRKDLTRGMATLANIPQPEYFVVSTRPESTWQHIWDAGMRQNGCVLPLPKDWDRLPPQDQEAIWLSQLEKAVAGVGGSAMVKPITTEFLKGATPLKIPGDDPKIAWERSKNRVGAPQVVIERLVSDIERELLVTVVKRADGSYVDVPAVWYRCVNDYNWRADTSNQSVPVAFDYARVYPEPEYVADPQIKQDVVGAQSLFDKARKHSLKMAEALWAEVEERGYAINHRFLQIEWLVTKQGELFLNEIKPTQLDKGIISNTAWTLSDSELLVRSLFDLPLPERISLARPQSAILCGAVLTIREKDITNIVNGSSLIGYSFPGIAKCLEMGVDVFLYPDKMRSKPYIGRRTGILTISADHLDRGVEILERARNSLEPQYGLA